MILNLKETSIPECFEIQPNIFKDERGTFVKTFNEDIFVNNGLETDFREQYYSVSHKGVLRGLHFQIPPMAHTKLVYCILGEVMDVVVDLRIGSPTYGKYEIIELTSKKANMIYIPRGLAHGFYVQSETAVLVYNVTTTYSANCDKGIHWKSVDIPWPIINPIVSERDNKFIFFNDFQSPFIYKKGL